MRKLKQEIQTLRTQVATQQAANAENDALQKKIESLKQLIIVGGGNEHGETDGLGELRRVDRKRRKKKHRETWGPGDFKPVSLPVVAMKKPANGHRQSTSSDGGTPVDTPRQLENGESTKENDSAASNVLDSDEAAILKEALRVKADMFEETKERLQGRIAFVESTLADTEGVLEEELRKNADATEKQKQVSGLLAKAEFKLQETEQALKLSEEKCEIFASDVAQLTAKLAGANSELEIAKKSNKSYEQEAILAKETGDAHIVELRKFQQSYSDSQEMVSKLQAKLDINRQELEAEVAQLHAEKGQLNENVGRLNDENNTLRDGFSLLEQKCTLLSEMLSKAESELCTTKESYIQERFDTKENAKEGEQHIGRLEVEVEEWKEKHRKTLQVVSNLETELDDANKTIAENKTEVESLKVELERLGDDILKQQETETKLRGDVKGWEKEKESLERAFDSVKATLSEKISQTCEQNTSLQAKLDLTEQVLLQTELAKEQQSNELKDTIAKLEQYDKGSVEARSTIDTQSARLEELAVSYSQLQDLRNIMLSVSVDENDDTIEMDDKQLLEYYVKASLEKFKETYSKTISAEYEAKLAENKAINTELSKKLQELHASSMQAEENYQNKLVENQAKISELSSKLEELQGQHQAELVENQAIIAELSTKLEELKALSEEAEDRYQQESAESKATIAEISAKLDGLQGSTTEIQERLRQECNESKTTVVELRSKVESLESASTQLEDLRGALLSACGDNDDETIDMDDAKLLQRYVHITIRPIEKERSELRQEILELQSRVENNLQQEASTIQDLRNKMVHFVAWRQRLVETLRKNLSTPMDGECSIERMLHACQELDDSFFVELEHYLQSYCHGLIEKQAMVVELQAKLEDLEKETTSATKESKAQLAEYESRIAELQQEIVSKGSTILDLGTKLEESGAVMELHGSIADELEKVKQENAEKGAILARIHSTIEQEMKSFEVEQGTKRDLDYLLGCITNVHKTGIVEDRPLRIIHEFGLSVVALRTENKELRQRSTEDAHKLEMQLEETRADLDTYEDQIKYLNMELQKKMTVIAEYKELKSERSSFLEKIADLEQTVSSLCTQVESIETARQSAIDELCVRDCLQQILCSVEESIASDVSKQSKREMQLESHNVLTLQRLEQAAEDNKQLQQEFSRERQDLEAQLSDLVGELDVAQAKLSTACSQKCKMESEIESLKATVCEITLENKNNIQRLQLETSKISMSDNIPAMEKHISQLQLRLDLSTQELDQTRNLLQGANKNLEEIRNKAERDSMDLTKCIDAKETELVSMKKELQCAQNRQKELEFELEKQACSHKQTLRDIKECHAEDLSNITAVAEMQNAVDAQKNEDKTIMESNMRCAIDALEKKVRTQKELLEEREGALERNFQVIQELERNLEEANEKLATSQEVELRAAIIKMEDSNKSLKKEVLDKGEMIVQNEAKISELEQLLSEATGQNGTQTEESQFRVAIDALEKKVLVLKERLREKDEEILSQLELLKQVECALVEERACGEGKATEGVSRAVEELTEKLGVVSADLKASREKCASLEKIIAEQPDKNIAQVSEDANKIALLNEELERAKAALEPLKEDREEIHARLRRQQEMMTKIDTERLELVDKVAELEGWQAESKEQKIEYEKQIQDWQSKQDTTETSLNSLKSEISSKETQIQSLQEEIAGQQDALADLHLKCLESQGHLEKLGQEKTEQKGEIVALASALDKAKGRLEKFEQMKLTPEFAQKVVGMKDENRKLKASLDLQVRECKELDGKLADANKRIEQLELVKMTKDISLKWARLRKENRELKVKYTEMEASQQIIIETNEKLRVRLKDATKESGAQLDQLVATVARKFGILDPVKPPEFISLLSDRLHTVQSERDSLEAEVRRLEDMEEHLASESDKLRSMHDSDIEHVKENLYALEEKYQLVDRAKSKLELLLDQEKEAKQVIESHYQQENVAMEKEMAGLRSKIVVLEQRMAEFDKTKESLVLTIEEQKENIKFLEKENLDLMVLSRQEQNRPVAPSAKQRGPVPATNEDDSYTPAPVKPSKAPLTSIQPNIFLDPPKALSVSKHKQKRTPLHKKKENNPPSTGEAGTGQGNAPECAQQ
mmetsp:Transcript_43732/g.69957  ORF Transcript_43732/g.69957 Transcript_43732/m.69957 type:complete len:2117 (-) Transcript_43732:1196-7546(-)